MLGLKLSTDPRWADIAIQDLQEVLTDHAFCELKAAATATAFISKFPDKSELVEAMVSLVREEISHFERVNNLLKQRGFVLGKERKDLYVNEITKFVMRSGYSRHEYLINKLLLAALIEARSCERFKLLSQNLTDDELKAFYYELMVSEANHYTLFLGFARKYAENYPVEQRWQEILSYEAEVMKYLGNKSEIHG